MNPEFLKFLEKKGYTEASYKELEVSKMAELDGEFQNLKFKELNDKLDGAVKEDDFKAVKSIVDDLKKLNISKALDSLEELNGEITKLKEKGNPNEKETFLESVVKVKEDLIGLVKGTKAKEVVIKANTTRASIVDNASQLMLPGIGQLGVKQRGLYDVFAKVPVARGDHAGKIVYTDWNEATITRAASMVAEGAAFDESTAGFRSYSVELKKVGDTLPVSEEFGEDQVSAAAELEMFLDVNVQTKIDDQIANGDNTGQNLDGALNSAPDYVPVASGIADANIYDLVKKVRTDITTNRGSKYRPDFAAFNSNTLDQLQLKKDANNNYIFPDRMNIGEIRIIVDNYIPENEMLVGQGLYGRIFEMDGAEISRGYTESQFTEDLVTLKARKRLLLLIKQADRTGFRHVTDISAALTTLAS